MGRPGTRNPCFESQPNLYLFENTRYIGGTSHAMWDHSAMTTVVFRKRAQKRVVRETRKVRAKWRALKTELRTSLLNR